MGVVIYQSVLWIWKEVTSVFSVLQITVCILFWKKCEADFVLILVNIWSNVLFLESKALKIFVRLLILVLMQSVKLRINRQAHADNLVRGQLKSVK